MELEKTRGQSLKKTSNDLGGFKNNLKSEFLQTQIPKTATAEKYNSNNKEYVSAIQKRIISKQLLSQVHFCRFVYKLLVGLNSKTSHEFSYALKSILIDLLFSKLCEVKELKLVEREYSEEYFNFGDYKKLKKLVEESEGKYQRKLNIEIESVNLKKF